MSTALPLLAALLSRAPLNATERRNVTLAMEFLASPSPWFPLQPEEPQPPAAPAIELLAVCGNWYGP